MKKIITSFVVAVALLSVSVISCEARSAESLYRKYANVQGAESVSLGKFWLNLAKMVVSMDEGSQTGDSEADMAMRILSNLTAVRVADLSDCSEEVIKRFKADAAGTDLDGYEVVTKVRDGEDNVSILLKRDGSVIKELLVLSYGEDPAIIQLEGEITEQEASEFISAAMSEDQAE